MAALTFTVLMKITFYSIIASLWELKKYSDTMDAAPIDPSNQMCDFAMAVDDTLVLGNKMRVPIGACIQQPDGSYIGNKWVDDECTDWLEEEFIDQHCLNPASASASSAAPGPNAPPSNSGSVSGKGLTGASCNRHMMCHMWAIDWTFKGMIPPNMAPVTNGAATPAANPIAIATGSQLSEVQKTSYGSVNDCWEFVGYDQYTVKETKPVQANYAKIVSCDEDGELKMQWYSDDGCDNIVEDSDTRWESTLKDGLSFKVNDVAISIHTIKCFGQKVYGDLLQ